MPLTLPYSFGTATTPDKLFFTQLQTDLAALAAVTGLAGQLPGTATNDNASAGNVGEFISSTTDAGSAVSLTTGTPANVTSISLTAGDWDVTASAYFDTAATTSYTQLVSSISTTSATLNTTAGRYSNWNTAATVLGTSEISANVPTVRISIASTTTVYLVARAAFTVSTMSAYGFIGARRVR